MNKNSRKDDETDETASVLPLRKKDNDGLTYARPAEIIATIVDLLRLTRDEFLKRVSADDLGEGIPSECLLYFVRRPPFAADKDVLFALFAGIRQRVLKAVPVPKKRTPTLSNRVAESSVDLEIQEAVLDKFQEMLCRDRQEYLDRLDFFECRFNAAVARLRSTARRDVFNEASHLAGLAPDSETCESNPEVEKALSRISDSFDGPKTDFLYRSKIHSAINSLPLDERRVVELFLQDIPIDSQESDTMTMVRILGCSEKTVRNRRDRAFVKIARLLNEEGAQ